MGWVNSFPRATQYFTFTFYLFSLILPVNLLIILDCWIDWLIWLKVKHSLLKCCMENCFKEGLNSTQFSSLRSNDDFFWGVPVLYTDPHVSFHLPPVSELLSVSSLFSSPAYWPWLAPLEGRKGRKDTQNSHIAGLIFTVNLDP